jgi:hypothetical protein
LFISCVILALLAKMIGLVVWIITFIDFYPGTSVGTRYFFCLFPNTGLLFCLEVVLQYERKGGMFIIILVSHLFHPLTNSRWNHDICQALLEFISIPIIYWYMSSSDAYLFCDLFILGNLY